MKISCKIISSFIFFIFTIPSCTHEVTKQETSLLSQFVEDCESYYMYKLKIDESRRKSMYKIETGREYVGEIGKGLDICDSLRTCEESEFDWTMAQRGGRPKAFPAIIYCNELLVRATELDELNHSVVEDSDVFNAIIKSYKKIKKTGSDGMNDRMDYISKSLSKSNYNNIKSDTCRFVDQYCNKNYDAFKIAHLCEKAKPYFKNDGTFVPGMPFQQCIYKVYFELKELGKAVVILDGNREVIIR